MKNLHYKTIKKATFFFLFIFSGIYIVKAQDKSTFQGYIYSLDSIPVKGISLFLDNNSRVVTSKENGYFYFLNISMGQHRLFIINGEDTLLSQSVIVDQTLNSRNFYIHINNNRLEDIVVESGINKYRVQSSNYVSKMPLENMENPQVYSTITGEILQQQAITDFSNALKNATGVYKINGDRNINTAGGTQYTIRGFATEATMMDGIASQTNGEFDPANIERIEVLKGPQATLYGGALTTFGGLINIVTKRPKDYFGGEFTYNMGSYGLNRGTIDLFGPLDRNKTLLYRINAAYQYQGSFQDAGYKKSFFLAPSLRYIPNERLTIDIDAQIYSGESTSPQVVYLNRTRKLIATNPEALNYNWKRSLTSNDIYIKTPSLNAKAVVNYKISNGWTSQTILSTNTRQSQGYYQYESIRGNTDDSLQRIISHQNTTNTNVDIQQNFIGDFHIGKFRNRLVFGLDYLHQHINNDNSPYVVIDTIAGMSSGNPQVSKLFSYDVDKKLASSTAASTLNHTNINIYSAYLQDMFNFTDKLLAMASVRVDRYASQGTISNLTGVLTANSKYNQTAWSPKFGLLYEIWENKISLFANYLNGFSNVSPVSQPLSDISGIFKPQHANQYEAGAKLQLFNGRLDLTASYYNIKVSNMTRTESIDRDGQTYSITVQDGTQRSRGIELELVSNPISGLNLIAGYSYNDSKFIKAASTVEGLRPNTSGPANLVNAWISYQIPQGKAKGLGIGFGGNYMGKDYVLNTTTTGAFTTPDYLILNGSLFYNTNRYRFSLNLNNVTNKDYFIGQVTLTPQMPRNITATVRVKI